MKPSFGPWTTAINTGNNPQLSTFWKRRLTLLVSTNRAAVMLTRSNSLYLTMLALLTIALPTVRSAPLTESQPNKLDAAVIAQKTSSKKNQKLPGRIYLRAYQLGPESIQISMPIISIDPNTGKWKKLLEEGSSPRISPDGVTLAFKKGDDIWNTDADKAENPGIISKTSGIPVWSPDSKQLIASSVVKDPNDPKKLLYNTWRIKADGSSRVPVPLPEGHYVVDWSSDGKWLLTKNKLEVFAVQPGGKNPRRLFLCAGNPRFSPDGRSVVYEKQRERTLHLINVDGKNKRILYEAPPQVFVMTPCWSPDGQWVMCMLIDLTVTADGTEELDPDPRESPPRMLFINVKTRKQRILKLPQQGKLKTWLFVGKPDWR